MSDKAEKTMKSWSVVTLAEPLEEIDIPAPGNPQGSEVVVEVTHCGICHSDLHFWDGYLELGDRKQFFADLGTKTPFTMGHEVVGRVSRIGPDVAGVSKGDLRLIYPWIGCGACADCRRGQDNMCTQMRATGIRGNPGGFATEVFVPDEKYLIDIDGLDPAVAATYACSGLTTFSAIRKLMPLESHEPIVIIGVGGLGLSAISILTAMGHKNIVAVDMTDEKLDAASAQGATAVVNSSRTDARDQLPARAGAPIKSVIDMVNSAETAQLAIDVLGKGGRLVQIGLFGGRVSLPLATIPLRAITITGNYVGTLQELKDLITLAKSGKLPPIPIDCRPRSQTNEALVDLRNGEVEGRVVLQAETAD